MNLLKRLWTGLVNKTAAAEIEPTPVVVEEEREPCGELFAHLCREAGVKQRTLDSAKLVELFEGWYSGSCDEQSILSSMAEFKAAHPIANAKLQGKM